MSNSPEHEPAVYNENLKRSSSSPQFMATAMPLSQSPSEELLRHLPSPSTCEPSISPSFSNTNSQPNLSKDRPFVIAGLEADPSDSLMAWDMRNLGYDADKCYQKLYAAVSAAQNDCLRDHLWHLLLKGGNGEESGNEVWKPKARRKTEYRRVVNDFTDLWAVPSSLRDVGDNKSMVRWISEPVFVFFQSVNVLTFFSR